MQRLSSSTTLFSKFVLPGAFVVTLPMLILAAPEDSRADITAIMWCLGCVFLVWWAKPIKRVSLNGDQFCISNYLREINVPITQLVELRMHRWNRTQNVVLFFDPPTAFGRKIRIITPLGDYERVAPLLSDIVAFKKLSSTGDDIREVV